MDNIQKPFYRMATNNVSDTVNAVDDSGETRSFVGFYPNADGAVIVVLDDPGTDKTVLLECLKGHFYPIRGVRINGTGTTATAYAAVFNNQ